MDVGEDRLLFAVPKKGRLQQAALSLLSGSDIKFRRQDRHDIALVKNFPIALIFLPAADIPTFVGEGSVHLGITGRDQVAEHDARLPLGEPSGVEEIMDLMFGQCKLQVQVQENPRNGAAITSVEELIGQTVSTSFTSLAEDYFAKLEGLTSRQHLLDGALTPNSSNASTRLPFLKTKIKYLGGSVEASCGLGVAQGIVDLVESGETMRAQGLKSIATVLESTAVLIRNRRYVTTSEQTQKHQKLEKLITARIRGVVAAQQYILCQYNVRRSNLPAAKLITPGKRSPTITVLEEEGWVAVSSMVERKEVANKMDELTAVGARDILILDIVNTRTELEEFE